MHMTREESVKYYEEKRQEVLKRIKPLLEDFIGLKTTNYDYVVEWSEIATLLYPTNEYLHICNDKIGCQWNSVTAVEKEALGWAFIKYWCKDNSLGAFDIQTKNVITRYWKKEESK